MMRIIIWTEASNVPAALGSKHVFLILVILYILVLIFYICSCKGSNYEALTDTNLALHYDREDHYIVWCFHL